jgi:hypothetical protein
MSAIVMSSTIMSGSRPLCAGLGSSWLESKWCELKRAASGIRLNKYREGNNYAANVLLASVYMHKCSYRLTFHLVFTTYVTLLMGHIQLMMYNP